MRPSALLKQAKPAAASDRFRYFLVQEEGNVAQSFMLAMSRAPITPARVLELYAEQGGDTDRKIVREVQYEELGPHFRVQADAGKCGCVHADEVVVSTPMAGTTRLVAAY